MVTHFELFETIGYKPDGLGDPDNWLWVTTAAGGFALYAAAMLMFTPDEDFTSQSMLRYSCEATELPNCVSKSSIIDCVFYGTAVYTGEFNIKLGGETEIYFKEEEEITLDTLVGHLRKENMDEQVVGLLNHIA